LASADAAKAYRAIGRLAAGPLKALPFLQQQLRLPAVADANQLSGWIRDLDSDDFNVRQKATHALERQGETAAPALRKKLEDEPTLEARRRAEALLQKEAAHRQRIGRALEVLEQTATDEARAILKALAEGADGCFTTLEARATLQRIAKRPN
jgi:HEAT repeat protein